MIVVHISAWRHSYLNIDNCRHAMKRNAQIVMIGPSNAAMGGIATVVGNYEKAGLFEKWGITYLETHVEGSAPSKAFAAVSALCRFMVLLIQRRVTLLHVHSAQYTSFWRKSIFILAAFAAGRPVIFHLHGCEFMKFYDRCGRVSQWFVRLILIKSSVVIALSNQWAKNIESINRDAMIVCIYNFVPVPRGEIVLSQKDKSPILLFLGRLGPRKGIYDLLDALVRIKNKIPDVILKCGGDGDLEQVRLRAHELGLERNIEILGWVRGEEKATLLQGAAIYVLPSYDEGMPMGILEAMSVGLPVISTTVGGIPEIIDSGIEGILLEPGDIYNLADSIIRLLCDPNLRIVMGNAAKEKVALKFCAEKIVPEIERIYHKLGASPV